MPAGADPLTPIFKAPKMMGRPVPSGGGEFFTIELVPEGVSVITDTGFSSGPVLCLPSDRTIVAVSAFVGGPSTSGVIDIDVTIDLSSIFSTRITIDANEGKSSTAATPAVISDGTYLANEVLRCRVIDGGTNASGPLTVTLELTG
jgi:hypothetical protein